MERLDHFVSKSLEEEYAHYRSILIRGGRRYDRQYHFDCLCFFWAVALGLATRYADLIIDMDVLIYDETRRDTEMRIQNLTDLTVDLSDYHVDEKRISRIFGRHRMTVSGEMVAIIQNALSSIGQIGTGRLLFL